MKRAALLLCLAGCSDPWAAGESGTYWLADASDMLLSGHLMFQVQDADRLKLEEAGELALTRDQTALVLRRLREHSTHRILDSERFVLKAEGSVSVGDGKHFAVTLDALPLPGGPTGLRYDFSWTGGMRLSGRVALKAPEGRIFWRRKGGGRCDVVLVAVAAVLP